MGVIGDKIRPREPEREINRRERVSRIAIRTPPLGASFGTTHTLSLKLSPCLCRPSPFLYPTHPPGMPITATHNIDPVVDGQIYIGKCVFSFLGAIFCIIFIDIRPRFLTVLLPPSPSTFADNLASRTSCLCARTFLWKVPTT